MRIDLLIKREDFPKIFEETFSTYLFNRFAAEYDVKWIPSPGVFFNKSLLCNHKLNIIYTKNIDRNQLKLLMSEYSYNSNPLKRLAQKFYISLSSSVYFGFFFKSSTVSVSPWLSELDELCIIPGNHSLRIIDLKKSVCRVVLKSGFNAEFIVNEINFRKRFTCLAIPKILKVDLVEYWYEEEQITGLPLNRIGDPVIKAKGLLDAQKNLLKLYGKTLERANGGDYFDKLVKHCICLIDQLPNIYSKGDKARILGILDFLTLNLRLSDVVSIDLVQSHGDFQPANILIGAMMYEMYLIDWEYTSRRTIHYDALVFTAEARSPGGLSKRLNSVLNGTDVSWKWCVNYSTEKLCKSELIIFLIEDLIVRLSELRIPYMVCKNQGLDVWIEEVDKMDWLADR